MLYYDSIDVSKGIDVNKISVSKECNICHYWYFLDKGFKFQPYVWNFCHDVLMMSMNLMNINGVDYRCIIISMSKSKALNLLQKVDLKKKDTALLKYDILLLLLLLLLLLVLLVLFLYKKKVLLGNF